MRSSTGAAGSTASLSLDRLVAEATRMIAEDGLAALSLRRLAAAVGVTAPALYGHVAGKEELLRRVATAHLDALASRLAAIEEPDPVAGLREMARAYVDHALDQPALFEVMFLFPPAAGLGGPTGHELPAATRLFEAAAAPAVAAAERGLLRDGADAATVATGLWMAAHGAATTMLLGFDVPAAERDRLVDALLDAVVAGFTRR